MHNVAQIEDIRTALRDTSSPWKRLESIRIRGMRYPVGVTPLGSPFDESMADWLKYRMSCRGKEMPARGLTDFDERKKRLPDAIVIEHPRLAGGHLGAARIADLNDPRFEFENVLPQSREFLKSAGIEREIPLIAAGGIRSFEDIARLQSLGAAAVQLGTPFAVTEEGDASEAFKQVLAGAKEEEMVEFTSVAGLPARRITFWAYVFCGLCAGIAADGGRQSRYCTSLDGKVWTPFQKLLAKGDTLWRVTINPADNRFFGVSYKF